MNKAQIKNSIVSAVLVLIFILLWFFRDPPNNFMTLKGGTMGTTYQIKYQSKQLKDYKSDIDSLLEDFNACLSTYIPTSQINRLNVEGSLKYTCDYFKPVLKESKSVYENTSGAFDPTVAPLVNIWGFGFKKHNLPDSFDVDSIMPLIGYDKVEFNERSVSFKKEGMELDFSAIAKGYGVDIISEFLEKQGIVNYMVEIGGEVRCKGLNPDGKAWRLGIHEPKEGEYNLFASLELKNSAMATSGNYRNYRTEDGEIISHTIDPKSGMPVRHNLLSATVVAKNCMKADAYATAFMVMGLDASISLLKKNEAISGFLIFNDEEGSYKTYCSPDLKEELKIADDYNPENLKETAKN